MIGALLNSDRVKPSWFERLDLEFEAIPPGSPRAYLLAAVIVGGAVGLRLLLSPWLQGLYFITLFPAVMFAALLCGTAAGTFAVAISLFGAASVLIPPAPSIAIATRSDALGLVIFALTAEMIVVLAAAMRASVRRLREVNDTLRTVYEANPDAVLIVDAEGIITDVNQRTLAMFGFTRAELVGRPVETLAPAALRPRHVGLRAAFLAENRSRAMGAGLEVFGRRQDGVEFPVEIQLGAMRVNGASMIIAVVRDLTREKAIAAALAAYALPDALFVHDHDGRFIQVNQQACDSTGYTRDELLTMRVTDLEQDFDLPSAQAEWRRFTPGGHATLYGRHRRKNGEVFPVEVSFGLLRADGQRIYIGVVRDISERLKADERIRHLQKSEILGQLTGGVAHDFNNVLAATVTNLELALLQADLPPLARKLIDNSLSAALSGAQLTRRLLAFARKEPLQIETVWLNDLVSGMADLLRRTLGSSIDVQLRLAPDVWPIATDRAQVESALLNLAINARDAMPAGGVLIVETANRAAEALADHATKGDYVALVVTDTGVGMSPEVARQAMEPFFTTKPQGAGTGLGLSIIHDFVRQSGGAVTIGSSPGAGTTVTLLWPRMTLDSPAPRERANDDSRVGGRETILVVEDREPVAVAACRMLEALGYTTLLASDAPAAMAILGDRPDVDLVFSDISLPGRMHGDALAREIRVRYPRVKLLLTSGDPPRESMALNGVEDFPLIMKPYRTDDLAMAVRQALA